MTILLDVAGAAINNGGTVTGAPAYRITGSNVRLTNGDSGRIRADGNNDSAIVLLGSGATIINMAGGIIRGASDFPRPEDAAVILGSDFADQVEDSGTIIGRVQLGGGDDIFQSLSGDSAWSRNVDLGEGNDIFFLRPVTTISLTPTVDGGPGIDRYISLPGTGNFNGPTVTNVEILELRSDSFVESFSGTALTRVEIDFTAPTRVFNALRFFNTPNADVVILEVADGFMGGVSVYDGSTIRSLTGSAFSDQVSVANDTVMSGDIDLGGGNDFLTISRSQFSQALQSRIGNRIDGGSGVDQMSVQLRNGTFLELGHVFNFETLMLSNGGDFNGEPQGNGMFLRGVNNFPSIQIFQNSLVTLESSNTTGIVQLFARSQLNIAADTTIGGVSSFFIGNPQLANDTQSVTLVNAGRVTGTIQFGIGDDVLDGASSSAAQFAIGGAGNDRLIGGAFADRLEGGLGGDELAGRGGSDWLMGGPGGDSLDGGDGFDYASYAAASNGVLADLVVWALNLGEAAGDSYLAVEGLIGSAFNDDLRGTGGDNWIYGGAGSDIAYGRAGNDVLIGEAGDDTLWGNEGNDQLFGGDGLDRLLGGAGADVLNGEGGFDFAHYDDATSGIVVELAPFSPLINGGGALGDQLFNIEGVVGSTFNDEIYGDGADNWLYGQAGNDVLDGRSGNDVLIGGSGDDFLSGLFGNDLLFGESGDDILIGGNGDDRLDGGAGNDALTGGSGADILIGNLGFDYAGYESSRAGVVVDLVVWAENSNEAAGDIFIDVEGLIGSAYADSLRGDAGANFLYGLGGDDFLFGRNGNDVLIGGDGDDTLFGNEGDDAIYGGAGNDRIMFGAGDGRDAVFEFAAGADVGDAIHFAASLGISSFTQLQGRMTQMGGDTLISFDAATSLTIVGVAPRALAANDFIFG